MKTPGLTLDANGRLDLELYNEATAFALTSHKFVRSRQQCECVLEDERQWEQAVKEGRFLPIQLYQDDSFVLRLVRGQLRPQEQDEWVGGVQGVLDVPDGELVVTTGMDFLDDPGQIKDEESSRIISVAAGKYLVTLYSYLSGVNGLMDLHPIATDKQVLAWFRKTRPGHPVPRWLEVWVGETGLMADSTWVDFLLHLEPCQEGTAPPLLLQDRMLHATQRRRPEIFPLGLPVENPVRPPKPVSKPTPPVKVDVLKRVSDITPQPFGGKPVLHPVKDLWQVYRIPFYCNDSVGCELILEFPNEAQAAAFQPTPNTVLERTRKRLRVGFGHPRGRWDLMKWLQELSTPLATVPDGTHLEMVLADEKDNDEGRQRWASTVRAGQWELEATWPQVSPDVVADAVAFCRSLNEKTGAKARDDQEADAVLQRLKGDILFKPGSVLKKGLQLIPKDPLLLDPLGAHVFEHRYGKAWPVIPILEEYELPGTEASKPASPAFKSEMEAFLAEAKDAPIVFKGARSQYRAKDFVRLGPGLKPVFRDLDYEVDGYAWKPLGNLFCELYQGVLVRAYARKNGNAVLTVYCSANGVLRKELYSIFSDGSSLTTTTDPGLIKDEPDKKIYRHHVENASFMILRAAHDRTAFQHLRTRKVRVLLVPKKIAGVAKVLDEFLVRSSGQ